MNKRTQPSSHTPSSFTPLRRRRKHRPTARLLPFLSNTVGIEDLEQHEVISMCSIVGTKGNTHEERISKLMEYANNNIKSVDATSSTQNQSEDETGIEENEVDSTEQCEQVNQDDINEISTNVLNMSFEHEPQTTDENPLTINNTTNTNEVSLFIPKTKLSFLEKREKRMQLDPFNCSWTNIDMGTEFNHLTSCNVEQIDSTLTNIPFFRAVFGSHEMKMSDSSKEANKHILVNKKLINVRLKKYFPYVPNPEYCNNDILYYEAIFCKHPSCLRSSGTHLKKVGKTKYMTNCTAKGKIVVLNGDTKTAIIYAKGQHDHSFFPAIDPRRITPDQRRTVIDMYERYKPKIKTVAHSTGLERTQVNGLIQRLKMSKQKSSDPFLSFKLMLAELEKKDNVCVILPEGMTFENMSESNFAVLFVYDELIRIGIQDGFARVAVGFDSVYKTTSFYAPINIIATVNKEFRGILLGISVAFDNSSLTLQRMLKSFVDHVRCKHGIVLRPTWMIDAAKANISALKQLKWTYCLCRYHVSERWKKHMRGISSDVQTEIAKHLVYMGLANDEETYSNYYLKFLEYCAQTNDGTRRGISTKSFTTATRHGLLKTEYSI